MPITSSLPHLPLDKESTHITQEMADQIFDRLVERYPERIEKIARDDQGSTNGVVLSTYAEATNPIIKEMSKIMPVPDSELGYIELTFELMRRCREALGYEIPIVKGKPLAPSIDGPYPKKLLSKPIFDKYMLNLGFTQSAVDAWVDEYYENNKGICYQKAEACRREVTAVYLAEFDPIGTFFRQKVQAAEYQNLIRHSSMVASELVDRICLTCEIIELDRLRSIQEARNKTIK